MIRLWLWSSRLLLFIKLFSQKGFNLDFKFRNTHLSLRLLAQELLSGIPGPQSKSLVWHGGSCNIKKGEGSSPGACGM